MTHADDDLFQSELVSIIAAEPGWRVHVQETVHATKDHPRFIELDEKYPIVAWTLVQFVGDDGKPFKRVEPMFVAKSDPIHSTEYRRLYSDVRPAPGQPKCVVSIRVVAPGADTPSA